MQIRISLEGVGNVQWVQEVAFADNRDMGYRYIKEENKNCLCYSCN